MKRVLISTGLFCFLSMSVLTSCDKNFDQVNKHPDLVETPNPDMVLPYLELTLFDAQYYTNFVYAGQFVHQVSDLGMQFQALTLPSTGNNSNYHFDYKYTKSLKQIIDFLDKTKTPELVNYQSIGRILKAYAFHTVTDLHGDIPYFEAGKGYSEKIFTPKYDDQKLIYADMLKELKEAATSFDPAKKLPLTSDIVYKGDIAKWKKFAYSFMLRLAMRMSKADPSGAQAWINTALQGGVMQSIADNFVVYYTGTMNNVTTSNGQALPMLIYPTSKLAEPFVAALRNYQDPRLKVYSALPNGDTTSSKQQGLPPFVSSSQVTQSLTAFSESPQATLLRYNAPFIHLSYAQVQLLLAEAAIKGWVTGDPKTYYENGVRAAMKQLAIFGEQGKISDAQVDDYLARNPYNPANGLELIATQYWIETHYNWFEAFANWRRTGYPILDQSVNVLPRRLPYPIEEVNINSQNVAEAVQRQGPDNVTTRIWWDK